MIKVPDAYRHWTILAVFLACFFPFCNSAAAQDATRSFYSSLQKRLIADGFDAGRIQRLYHNEAVFFEAKGVTAYFQHNEATLDYDKLTHPNYIDAAKEYMHQHKRILRRARKYYGVDPRVVTAVMLVETHFGAYVGKRSILNTLSTMAVLTDAAPREYIWEQLPPEARTDRAEYDHKAHRKAEWAYNELKAFLTYTQRYNIDAATVPGSYAGAVGIPQFMPSNILVYGKDGNGDGQIDLFNDADAIFSIANFLKNYGWKPGLKHHQAYNVLLNYNHSKYYVNAILKIVHLLEG
jgi:membrane-bound lytic murein transglycosylase B